MGFPLVNTNLRLSHWNLATNINGTLYPLGRSVLAPSLDAISVKTLASLGSADKLGISSGGYGLDSIRGGTKVEEVEVEEEEEEEEGTANSRGANSFFSEGGMEKTFWLR